MGSDPAGVLGLETIRKVIERLLHASFPAVPAFIFWEKEGILAMTAGPARGRTWLLLEGPDPWGIHGLPSSTGLPGG